MSLFIVIFPNSLTLKEKIRRIEMILNVNIFQFSIQIIEF